MKKQISQNTPLSQAFPQGEKGVITNGFFPSTRGGGIKGWGCKAFTLVELIVVITILAILGTIAFISLQGYSKDARDVKRISDVRSLLTKLNVEQSVGTPLNELITGTKTTLQILGEDNENVYTMGVINFTNLNEKEEDFQDPKNGQDYYFAYATGQTGSGEETNGYNFVQGATISEIQNTTKILGNYYTNTPGDALSLFMTGGTYYVEGQTPIYDINDGSNNNNNNGGTTPPPPPPITPSCDETTIPTGEGVDTTTIGTPISTNQSWQNTNPSNACYYTCKANYSGTNCTTFTPPQGVYEGSEEQTGQLTDGSNFTWKDITITHNGTSYTLMDRNLGATTAYTAGATESTADTINSSLFYGYYYQWGSTGTGWTDGSSSLNYDWQTRNDNAWGDNGGNGTSSQRQGPCPTGYHVPSTLEWDGLVKLWFSYKGVSCTASAGSYCSWSGNTTLANFKSDLKIPLAGGRNRSDGDVYGQGIFGYYWSSSSNSIYAHRLYFTSSSVNPQYRDNRAYGFSVRCFKN